MMSNSLTIFISFKPNADSSAIDSGLLVRLLLGIRKNSLTGKNNRAELLSLPVRVSRVNLLLPQASSALSGSGDGLLTRSLLLSGNGSLWTVAAELRGTTISDKSSKALLKLNFGNLPETYPSPIKVIHSGELPLRKGFSHFSLSFSPFGKDGVFTVPPPGFPDLRPTHRRLYGRGIFNAPSDGAA